MEAPDQQNQPAAFACPLRWLHSFQLQASINPSRSPAVMRGSSLRASSLDVTRGSGVRSWRREDKTMARNNVCMCISFPFVVLLLLLLFLYYCCGSYCCPGNPAHTSETRLLHYSLEVRYLVVEVDVWLRYHYMHYCTKSCTERGGTGTLVQDTHADS